LGIGEKQDFDTILSNLTSAGIHTIFIKIDIWKVQMNSFIKIMKALSDPNRLKIVKMLQHRALCVCEIQSALGISQPNVSSHLRILENAGLVEFHKDGLWVNYYLSDGKDSPYVSSLLGNLRHWLEDDPEIAKLMKKVPNLDRSKILRR